MAQNARYAKIAELDDAAVLPENVGGLPQRAGFGQTAMFCM